MDHDAPDRTVGTDVVCLLASPDARVVPPPVAGAALAAGRDRMARFVDGDAHERARSAVNRLVAGIDIGAACDVAARIGAATVAEGVDAVEWARATVAAAMTAAVGMPSEAVDDLRQVSRALAPRPDAPVPGPTADASWARAIAAVRSDDPDVGAASISLVHQAHDATAGLVAAALRVSGGNARARVDRALREAPPVVCTTRRTTAPVRLPTRLLGAGTLVEVDLADHPFGAGPHRCPGEELARALAISLVACVLDQGLEAGAVVGPDEPRRNLRIPSALPLQRADTSRPTAS